MAMAEVFLPSSAHDSIPPLLLPTSTSPPFLSHPPSTCSSYHDEQDHAQTTPPAPPPSPQEPMKFGPVFEIDASYFERPRKIERSPSPTNSLDFSAIFTPNKSPLESEPHSPVQPSPGDPIDSTYCSAHPSMLSHHSYLGSSQSIPISPTLFTGGPAVFCSHSDDPTFRNGMRSHTALAQHPHAPSAHHLITPDSASPAPRPRSHTHPSHTLTPSLLHEQHPHLPRSFEATQLMQALEGGRGILDSGYHEALSGELPVRQKKMNLKRKSEELGYDGESMDQYSCDSYSESGCSGSESDWGVVHKCSKKTCQEGRNPVIRRQSSSFSGGFTYGSPLARGREGLANSSAPSTPRHPATPLDLSHPPSLSPPVFPSPHHSPFTPTPFTELPASLQSMEVEVPMESLDSMDTGEHSVEMDSLSCQLRGSHLQYGSHGNGAPPPHNMTLLAPQGGGYRSHSSGDSYDFGLHPQLAQGVCGLYFSSYHESSQNVLNESSTAENRFLLSKSL